MQELVSIIIPTYNRAHFIGQTLDAVLAQTYSNWECIVVDDGSTDYTDELLEFYCDRDSRIQYHHRPLERPKGANACRNYGFEMSKGEYIQWLDSDDLLSENKISGQAALLNNENDFSIVYCKWGVFDYKVEDSLIYEGLNGYQNFNKTVDFLESLAANKGYFPMHCYLIPRKLIFYSGLWLEKLKINQDGEFMIRIMLNVKNFLYEKESYALYRNGHQGRISDLDDKEKVEMMIESWKVIQSLVLIKNDFQKTNFLSNSKKGVYLNVKRSYPELIVKNRYFFEEEIYSDKNDQKGFLKFFYKKITELLK